jgi:hypothetical protein
LSGAPSGTTSARSGAGEAITGGARGLE